MNSSVHPNMSFQKSQKNAKRKKPTFLQIHEGAARAEGGRRGGREGAERAERGREGQRERRREQRGTERGRESGEKGEGEGAERDPGRVSSVQLTNKLPIRGWRGEGCEWRERRGERGRGGDRGHRARGRGG
jgi:hypothetical protein